MVTKAETQAIVCIDAPIAQEGPILARLFDAREIAINHQNFFFIGRRFRDEATERIRYKGLAPERELALMPDAVDDDHEESVRNRMAALNCFPGGMLRFIDFRIFVRQPADCRRVEKKLRAAECG